MKNIITIFLVSTVSGRPADNITEGILEDFINASHTVLSVTAFQPVGKFQSCQSIYCLHVFVLQIYNN